MDEQRIKHLEMIEGVINRMASNSSKLKEWTMTLVVAICALGSTYAGRWFILLALIPTIGFWILDSYYLTLECKYRYLYKKALNNEVGLFVMNYVDAGIGKPTKKDIYEKMKSISKLCFYPFIIVSILLVFIITIVTGLFVQI